MSLYKIAALRREFAIAQDPLQNSQPLQGHSHRKPHRPVAAALPPQQPLPFQIESLFFKTKGNKQGRAPKRSERLRRLYPDVRMPAGATVSWSRPSRPPWAMPSPCRPGRSTSKTRPSPKRSLAGGLQLSITGIATMRSSAPRQLFMKRKERETVCITPYRCHGAIATWASGACSMPRDECPIPSATTSLQLNGQSRRMATRRAS